LQGKGRTLVYFDSDVKMCLDVATKMTVCEEDASYPTELPLLPEVKDAAAVSGACMISMVVAVNVAGEVTEPTIGPGVTKKLCNLKVATGNEGMSAAFWEPMASQMAQASVGEVFRLDWMTLVPEGNGMFKISSAAHSTSRLQTGDAADSVRSALATDVESMSATYGRSRAEKLKELFTQGSLSTLDHIQRLNAQEGGYAAKCIMIPAVFVKDIRGMSVENSLATSYLGCTQCKKQLPDSMHCETHGVNNGKKVYGAQILFADPCHKLEVAVWEDCLKAMCQEFGVDDMDDESALPNLLVALRAQEMCIRASLGINKSGTSMYLDVFDVRPQVNDAGAQAIFKHLPNDTFVGAPGIVPACCKLFASNSLGQTVVTVDALEHVVDSIHLVCKTTDKPKMEVLPDIDGINVKLTAQCMKCNCRLNGALQVAHRRIIPEAEAQIFAKSYKYQAEQFVMHMKIPRSQEMSKERTTDIEELCLSQRTPKRLKIAHTLDGDAL
ncbi:unnamed protein product, partial [Polarella glacialis]